VIGVPNHEFGEVPVAIVRSLESITDPEAVKRIVLEKLGPDYALEDIVALPDLGYENFPLNATGKVVKHELRQAYLKLHETQ